MRSMPCSWGWRPVSMDAWAGDVVGMEVADDDALHVVGIDALGAQLRRCRGALVRDDRGRPTVGSVGESSAGLEEVGRVAGVEEREAEGRVLDEREHGLKTCGGVSLATQHR